MLKTFKKKIKDGRPICDKAIKLYDTGARINSIDIGTPDEPTKVNTPKYLQSSYHELNGCVWLGTCLFYKVSIQ